MMQLSFQMTMAGGSLDLPGQSVSFALSNAGYAPRVVMYDFGYGEASVFELTANGVRCLDTWVLGVGARSVVDIVGYGSGVLDMALLDLAGTSWSLGQQSAIDLSLGRTGVAGYMQQASVLTFQAGTAAPLTFVAAANGSGISAMRINAAGTVTSCVDTADTATQYLAHVSDMVALSQGGQNYLYATSALEHGLGGWQISDTGSLKSVVQIGRSESLPVQTMNRLVTGTSGDSQFLVAGAMGSSSLSVMRVKADGTLQVTDHIIDGLLTRFEHVTELEAVTHDGRMYILAAGQDAGLSLFTLTAEGRLVHLHSLADFEGASLGGVSGLAAVLRNGGLDVLTTAAQEAELSLFRVELPKAGVVQAAASGTISGSAGDDMLSLRTGAGKIQGGAGNDILSDGAGYDTLSGGSGQDIFVLCADGQRDLITDIDVAQDKLDLSGWSMFRNLDQLLIKQTTRGAVIQFGEEVLELRSATGNPLTAQQIGALVMQGPSHYNVEIGPLQESIPEPTPTPPPPIPSKPVVVTNPDPAPPPVTPPPPTSVPSLRLIGANGNDVLKGGAGDDYIDGGSGNDTLYGGVGNDGILAGLGDDLVYGGAGDDNIPGKAGDDTLYGGNGNDLLGGSDGFDLIFGGAGDDVAGGGNQNDTMNGGAGNDWFSGGWGHDIVRGNEDDDKLAGSYGNDTVLGGDGNDSMGGGQGRDILRGQAGNDIIGAGEDNDRLFGDEGNDSLGGADGDDVLYGGAGSDTLNGAHGNDTMYGGAGADVFLFNNFLSSGDDVVQDFEVGVDHLRLVGVHLGPAAGRLDKLQMKNGSLDGEHGAWLKYGDHVIFLVDVDAKDLSAADFLFS